MNNGEGRCTVEASAGVRLEAALHEGDGRIAAVVLHPHTLYGGDMDNHVVRSVCDALAAAGASTLRLNFRGAGESDGAFDSGRGETLDAVAAVALMRERTPRARLLLAGYSFGATVASRAAEQVAPDALILVSPPAGAANPPSGASALIITGDQDRIAPPEVAQGLAGAGRQVAIVAGVDHGWWPGIEELASLVTEFANAQLSSVARP